MQMYLAGDDGIATDWHFQHLAKYAVAGAGCVFGAGMHWHSVFRGSHTHAVSYNWPMEH